ncbi:Telomerase-binding protein EST1A [Eumeta japonica]|uniref:Telomerase-binding protein EST1A n=1 Tax=Eumeta variegata TaxID=151549 RepID=A0A4C1WAQ0_EUMVA|nr:Telomerase-binding protein EST1A [Eumeta japonica]
MLTELGRSRCPRRVRPPGAAPLNAERSGLVQLASANAGDRQNRPRCGRGDLRARFRRGVPFQNHGGEILRGGWVSVELEVRPRWLVPDTNCFIDHLPLLQRVAAAPGQPYLLAVPLVVVTELEGLRRCGRVGGAAGAALGWLCGDAGAAVRFATSRGTLLASRTFTAERAEPRTTNDDRVLATALNLHANLASEPGEMPPYLYAF